MWKILSILLLVAGFSGTAEASNFVWKDKAQGFTVSFPDEWTVQTEDTPTTRIRIAGPAGDDFATCRVKAEKDGRLKIYPQELATKAVYDTLGQSFWENEAAQFDKGTVTGVYSVTGGGKQIDAMGARISFLQESGAGKMEMRGTMVGSIYGDMRYVASCFARKEVFKKYSSLFNDIMGSVELDSKYTPFASGYYRDFMSDTKIYTPPSHPRAQTNVPLNKEYIPSGM